MAYKQLFGNETISLQYALFRPTYPDELYKTILSYCSRSSKRELAVDVACGSGQSTKPLTKWYKQVIGTDINTTQVCEQFCHLYESVTLITTVVVHTMV